MPEQTEKAAPQWTRAHTVLAIVVVAALAWYFWQPSETATRRDSDPGAAEYAEEYGGSVSAYRRILSLSSCVELQAEFDVAAANNDVAEPGTPAHLQSLGFMNAAQARMDSLGRC